MPQTPSAEWLTVTQAADHLGISTQTVRRWASDGRLRHVVGPTGRLRFRVEDLDAAFVVVEPTPVAAS